MFENPAWLFAIATLIASSGITVAFKQLMNLSIVVIEEKENEQLQRGLTNFFIKIAVIEILPILLTVFAIIKLQHFSGTIDDMILPMAIIGAIYILSLLVIFISAKQVQNDPKVSEKINSQVSTFMMMGIAISSTFPLIAFVMIFIMA